MYTFLISLATVASLTTLTSALPHVDSPAPVIKPRDSPSVVSSAVGSLKTPDDELAAQNDPKYNSKDATVLLPILEEVAAANDANISTSNANSTGLLGKARPPAPDNCKGSYYCGWNPWFSNGANHDDCLFAYERFDARTQYERKTARTHGTSFFTSFVRYADRCVCEQDTARLYSNAGHRRVSVATSCTANSTRSSRTDVTSAGAITS